MKTREEIEKENNDRIAFINQYSLPVNTVIDYKDEYVCMFHYPYGNNTRSGCITLKHEEYKKKLKDSIPREEYSINGMSKSSTTTQVIIFIAVIIAYIFFMIYG